MLFAQRLSLEAYEPWKEHYIAYEQLKKLLKESVAGEYEWTEEDESRFVQMLDKELDKVYGFEESTYDNISKRLGTVEEQVHALDFASVSKQLSSDLERILDDATQIDRFRRLNYTGFTKLVRKHDRLHSHYRLMPLLQARFRSVRFHTEDYSPLLRRISHIYTYMDEQSGSTEPSSALARSHKLNSIDKDYHSKGYVTLQFWVHPDNLMEVKTRVLRRLPVLVYNREDDDEESGRDPVVTSLYLDNREFSLYQSLLERGSTENDLAPTSLRFRWYGKLVERPEIVLEQHNEVDGRITRATLKEKTINKYLAGDKDVVEKQARKMRERHVQSRAVEDYKQAAGELQRFVQDQKLEPMLRTVYRRTAFEIPGDDRVRVILDQDIVFLREDALNRSRPIRDPSQWHRADLDEPGINLSSVLRKGEHAKFPFSVLEVRLRADAASGVTKLPWIEELQKLNLVKEVPHFTKFLQGVAVLFGDDDRLDSLPFWLSELDPHPGHGETGEAAEQGEQSAGGQRHGQDRGQDRGQEHKPKASSSTAHLGAQGRAKFSRYAWDEDEFDSEDSGILDPVLDDADEHTNSVGFPTRVHGKLSDEESEDDEVALPPGVEEPSRWIKNQASPKIEAKVWLANERTFNKWLHITCLLSALTFTLYSSVGHAASTATATVVAYVLFGLTVFCGLWGYTQYLLRIRYIKERGDRPLDAPLGPIVVSVGLLIALVINFSAMYKNKTGEGLAGEALLNNQVSAA